MVPGCRKKATINVHPSPRPGCASSYEVTVEIALDCLPRAKRVLENAGLTILLTESGAVAMTMIAPLTSGALESLQAALERVLFSVKTFWPTSQ